MRRLLVTANIVLSTPIIAPLTMEALRSSETSVLRRAFLMNSIVTRVFVTTVMFLTNRCPLHFRVSQYMA
jgi:hypothetical protein